MSPDRIEIIDHQHCGGWFRWEIAPLADGMPRDYFSHVRVPTGETLQAVKGYAKIDTGHARITVVQCPGTHTPPQPEENA